MEFAYTEKADNIICAHERKALCELERIADSLTCVSAGLALETQLIWKCFPHDETSDVRLPFANGYECYACCNVVKYGNIVRVKSNDGEADYYELSACWQISRISRRLFHNTVWLNDNADDMREEIEEMLSRLGG